VRVTALLVADTDTAHRDVLKSEKFVRRRSIGLGLALLGLATTLPAQTLHDAVEAAWRLNPDTVIAASGVGEAAAQRDVAQGWLAAPPSASLSQSSDRFGNDEGKRVQELEVELPLWRWGQREARQGLAQAGTAAVEAELRQARWQLAGEVREAFWAASLAALDVDTARRRLAVAERIEQEVGRHVAVGDLARADLLLVQSEKTAAQASLLDAEQGAREAAQRYTVLTGLPGWSLPAAAAALPDAPLDSHPQLQRALAERQRAERAGDNARQSSNEPLALIVGAERERERYGASPNNIVRLGIKIPFGGATWNQPNLAAVDAARSRAELNEGATRRAVAADVANARAAHQLAETGLALASARQRAAEEHASLLRKGFALGETGLAALLRAESLQLDARAGAARQQLLLGQARSRLEHSLGLLP
jgi:cobalt-zinc-cadmium efflux system outer membrane protein